MCQFILWGKSVRYKMRGSGREDVRGRMYGMCQLITF